jgi:hypothetical protein
LSDYQIDGRRLKELRVGREGEPVAVFRRQSWFVQHMVGEVGGQKYQMKLPAPWTGFRYRLRQGDHEHANATRPRYPRRIASCELELPGRKLRLAADNRHGLDFTLFEGEEECGRLLQRPFEEQGDWEADLQAPEDWSIPLAAFVGWIVQEIRSALR